LIISRGHYSRAARAASNNTAAAGQSAGAVAHLQSHFPGFTSRVTVPSTVPAGRWKTGGNPLHSGFGRYGRVATGDVAATLLAQGSGDQVEVLSGLGFSLKPPAWLRNFAGAVMKGTQISVPTPAGVPIVVDGSDPSALQKIINALKGTQVSTTMGKPAPSLPQQAENAIESIPGGWFTIIALGLGVFLLLKRR